MWQDRAKLARLAVTERGRKNTPQHPVPCHSERALGRVELLRCAAKALWALAPCGIWDGLLGCIFIPRDPRSEPFAPRPRFTRVSTALKMTRGTARRGYSLPFSHTQAPPFISPLPEGGYGTTALAAASTIICAVSISPLSTVVMYSASEGRASLREEFFAEGLIFAEGLGIMGVDAELMDSLLREFSLAILSPVGSAFCVVRSYTNSELSGISSYSTFAIVSS